MSYYTWDRSVPAVAVYFPRMLFSSQQVNACEASDSEVGHIEFTQFSFSLQAWSVTNLHMYTGERKNEWKKKKDSPARPKEKPVKENSKIKQHNFES